MELQLHDQDFCTTFKINVFIKLFSTMLNSQNLNNSLYYILRSLNQNTGIFYTLRSLTLIWFAIKYVESFLNANTESLMNFTILSNLLCRRSASLVSVRHNQRPINDN